MPYDERPSSLPLDREECRTAIWRMRGNITNAAKLLKVDARRLRAFVRTSPYLSGEVLEAAEQLQDIAEDVVYDALTDEQDKGRKDSMARFVLASQGRGRGWGSGGNATINLKSTGPVSITWGDGSQVNSDPKTIDGEVSS